MGIGELLAAHSERRAPHVSDHEVLSARDHAVASLKAAHQSMQDGDFDGAHEHMKAYHEHREREAYDEPAPSDADAGSQALIIIPHKG
jgi:hypothetical protein